jgi:hypothetical protein
LRPETLEALEKKTKRGFYKVGEVLIPNGLL